MRKKAAQAATNAVSSRMGPCCSAQPGRQPSRRPGRLARARPRSQQVTLDEHRRHDGDEHHPELGLDQRGRGGEGGRTLAVAADEGGQTQQDHQRAGSVGLAPQGRVVERDGVEDVERRCCQRQGLAARARPGPAADQAVDDVADEDVEQDRRQLDQLGGADRCARERAHQPEHVEVGRRIVGEAGVGIEAGRSVLRHRAGPRGVGREVRLEARAGEEHVGDEQPQRQACEQQDHDGGAQGKRGQGADRLSGATADPTHRGRSHRRRPASWESVEVAPSISTDLADTLVAPGTVVWREHAHRRRP